MAKWIAIAGALLAAIGVAFGAFGAHGLENALQSFGRGGSLVKRLGWFDTAVRYQLFHAIGLLALSALTVGQPGPWQRAAAWLFLAGIFLFSGSLYAMTFGPDTWRKLGMVTPLGGLALILAWLTLAIAVWRT